MEENWLKKDRFSAEYRFAKDLLKAVVEMRTISVPNFWKLQLENTFLTVAQRIKVKELFTKEWHMLDEKVKRFTSRDGRSDYSDRQFLLCVVQFIEEYKLELKSEDEFLRVCSRIAYVAASFLRNNDQSDAISVAVDRVYEMIIDTFYSTIINEDGPIIKNISDHKYRFAYDLVQTLVEMRGVPVPDLELLDSETFFFTSNHKNKVKELFSKEWVVLDELLKSFACKDGAFDYSDGNLLRCMNKIEEDFGSEQNTEYVLVCARIAYAAAWFLNKNSSSNAYDFAVDRIHQMVRKAIHFNKYEKHNDYRFSCDLVKAVVEMRSQSSSSFFMIAHQNKIEELLSRERSNLDEVVRKFTSKDDSLHYNDNQFLLCTNQIIDKTEYNSKDEIVTTCMRIAYVAASFLTENSKSNAPGLAMDCMLKLVKDINHLPKTEDEEVMIMRTRDDHYRFAYDLVKTVLEMKSVPVSDIELPDPDNFLFTDIHRNKIEHLFSKESSQLDKAVEQLTSKYGTSDYSDSNFLQCMRVIMKKYQYDHTTVEGQVYIGSTMAYLSACFSKANYKSNSPFLVVNYIYEMMKEVDSFNNSTEKRVLIVKMQDDNYRFAYDLAKAVFEFKGILVSPLELPILDHSLFTDSHRSKVQSMLSKEWSRLDEMVTKVSNNSGLLDYSDNKFIYCMNQIIHDYDSDQKTEESFLYACARIAYTAAVFLIKNNKLSTTFLAVNRIYKMTQDSFHNKLEGANVKEEIYSFVYDSVTAALRIKNNYSFKIQMSDLDNSPFTIKDRNTIQNFLSKEWPRLHQLVRRFTKTSADTTISDGHFLHFMEQVINDYEPEQNPTELLLVSARIAYVATCFLRKNQNSNAADLALDRMYRMRKKYLLRNTTEAKTSVVDVRNDKYRFAYDLVRAVMELKGMPVRDAELPDPDNFLFTSQNRKKIKKFLRKECSNIDKIVENLTNKGGNMDYSDNVFRRCMDKIYKDYKSEQANKDGFVRLCARIAYPATYFTRRNNASNAIKLAVERIYEMVRNIVYFNKDLEDNLIKDVKDNEYRFAYDIVKAAVELLGTQIPNIEFPHPNIILFTSEHKHKIKKFLSKENSQLVDLMNRITYKDGNLDFSDNSFMECMDQIIEYKPKCYTEEGFVILCSRIAYVASCFLKKTPKSNATLLAVNRIHAMVKDILSRGSLSQSSW